MLIAKHWGRIICGDPVQAVNKQYGRTMENQTNMDQLK